MDNNSPASSASSSSSDSDAFNTESARVYFGPFKTPERKFITAAKSLFPPQPPAVRRSPRLSSFRPRSDSPVDVKETEDDIRDIEQVEQLVHDSGEDERNPGTRTPPPGEDSLQDEPSSALADRVLHALDNPSPPPSPPSTLCIFDPYHASTPEGPTDYHRDLMSLKLNDAFEADSAVLPLVPIDSASSPGQSSTPVANNAPEECLIAIDSFSAQSQQIEILYERPADSSFSWSRPILSVDDLLSQSPTVFVTPPQPPPSILNPSPENSNTFSTVVNELEMIVENSESKQGESADVIIATSPSSPLMPEAGLSVPLLTAEGSQSTPLRRSTRPRKSVTLMVPTTVNTPVFVAPPSIARTQVKKKAMSPTRNDEVVSDSQGEDSDSRESPPPSNATSTVRVRHRSPGKAPLSFRRELGSLSPTSSNVLASLAFSAPDEHTVNNASSAPTSQAASSSQQSMLSFSVFTPPNEAPNTPARTSGPVRFQSPPKATGPNKYQIKTSTLGDPTNTPARRVPLEEGIAQGYVSPEKVPRLGFSTTSTPLPSQATPARRVPIADIAAPALIKSTNLRPASPLKKSLGQRESSIEPMERSGSSVKGKEKALQVPEARPRGTTKLPFPLVPVPSTSTVQYTRSEDIVHVRPSPTKSTLKQPTSRIPRIGTKPYSRSDPKIPKKTTVTTTDVAKPPSKVIDSAAIARKNARDAMKSITASTSRSKPIATTSITTTLKRKREGEVTSPVKPRVIMLRQVPPLPTLPIEKLSISQPTGLTTTAPSKGKKSATAQTLTRIRYVVDPQPTVTVSTASPRKSSPEPDLVLPVKSSTPLLVKSLPPAIDPASSNRQMSPELTPGSPMNEDTVEKPTQELNQANAESLPANNLNYTEDATYAAATSSGLRRTTRSRRSAAMSQDVFTEGSSRSGSTRRKAPVFHYDDVFSGMSLTALKDLTVSNTVKNQRYVAANLETEVIRKEGTRPESPAVKIRTIVQRQQDEREKERTERANRRARRSGEDIPSSDMESSNNATPSGDPMSEDDVGKSPVRHRRGAGEDDDYVTPETYRHIKPLRLFGDATEEQEREALRRRVKWDRGLFTTVYLDEVKLGSRQPLKENRALKSILAPTAKAIRLDTLGNHPHAELPLSDIVQENITVKKIVYDSDVADAVAEVAAAARSTRSKSKKK